MSTKSRLTLPLALVVAAAFSASPALAQHGNGHGSSSHGRSESHDRDHDRNDDHRRDDRRDDHHSSSRSDTWHRSNGTLSRRVPPGWCTGRGNPHNTVANCGVGSNRYDRRYDPRYNGTYGNRTPDRFGRTYDSRTGRYYDSRTGRYYDQYGNVYGNTGSSSRSAFDAWKRNHDAQCRALARQRPLDLSYQSRLRSQCVAEERDARRRYGV
jgi:hypothetical protein